MIIIIIYTVTLYNRKRIMQIETPPIESQFQKGSSVDGNLLS